MEDTGNFVNLTELIRNADAYMFLAGWLYMMYTKRLRWGWDYDKMDADHEAEKTKLQELVARYQNQVQERLDKLEAKGESNGD